MHEGRMICTSARLSLLCTPYDDCLGLKKSKSDEVALLASRRIPSQEEYLRPLRKRMSYVICQMCFHRAFDLQQV